jgi:lambda family phage portal protein
MSGWLKALAVIAPGAAMKRAAALQALRSYDGAKQGFRAAAAGRSAGSANAALSQQIARLTARAHDLVRNTPEAARTIEVLSSHIVGSGVHVAWNTGSDRRDRQITDLWDRWQRVADMEGVLGFAGLQKLAVQATFEGGDVLARLIDTNPAASGAARGVPGLRIQLLEGEQLETSQDSATIGAGPRIRLGIEIDEWNRRQAFHVLRDPDGERLSRTGERVMRLPAEDVCHLFRPLRPGQLRGVTVFAPVLLAARDHADLIEALTIKARMEACFGLGVETPDVGKMRLAPSDGSERTADGKPIEDLHPGMIVYTRPGEKITSISPTGGLAAEPILLANLMRFASGVNLTYDQVTGDLRQANYSSLRAGKIEFFRFVEQFQWLHLAPMLLDRIVERWLERAVMGGFLTDRREGYAYDYVMPAREPIDPKKDLEADIMAVRAGRMSPQEFIGAWGRDWRKVVAETSEFLAEIDRQGLVLDIDPRRTTQTGAAQGQGAADPAAEPQG